METVKGCHGEFNMGSPGGWEYQRIAQLLGKMGLLRWVSGRHYVLAPTEILMVGTRGGG